MWGEKEEKESSFRALQKFQVRDDIDLDHDEASSKAVQKCSGVDMFLK